MKIRSILSLVIAMALVLKDLPASSTLTNARPTPVSTIPLAPILSMTTIALVSLDTVARTAKKIFLNALNCRA